MAVHHGTDGNETSQQWLLRHLRRLLLPQVEEQLLTDFIHRQDLTTFRDFMHDPTSSRALFILLTRKEVLPSSPTTAAAAADAGIQQREKPEVRRMRDTAVASVAAPRSKKRGAASKKTPPSQRQKGGPEKKKHPPKHCTTRTVEKKQPGQVHDEILQATPKCHGLSIHSSFRSPSMKNSPASNCAPKPSSTSNSTGTRLTVNPFQSMRRRRAIQSNLKGRGTDGCYQSHFHRFIFISFKDPSSHPPPPSLTTHKGLDQAYTVGYCTTTDVKAIKRALGLVKSLLNGGGRLPFHCQVDMLLAFKLGTTPMMTSSPLPPPDAVSPFEQFIAISVAEAERQRKASTTITLKSSHNTTSGNEEADMSTGDFLKDQLRARIFSFSNNSTATNRTQLLLELSLYELKFVEAAPYSSASLDRIKRGLTVLHVLQLISTSNQSKGMAEDGEGLHFLPKVVFHLIELNARLLTTNIQQRLWNMINQDGEGEAAISSSGGNRSNSGLDDATHCAMERDARLLLLSEAIPLGLRIMSSAPVMGTLEGLKCVERMRQCLVIIGYIVEEMENLKVLLADLRDPARDMTFDRTPLREADHLVHLIWTAFEESYFETSLESGNYDSIKGVYVCLTDLLRKIKGTIPPLDPYCLPE